MGRCLGLMKENKKNTVHIPYEVRNYIPRHIAIITDGNGRWAKRKGLPRSSGHYEGVNRVEEITKACYEAKVEVLTWYCFSTENWKRTPSEVNNLMKIFTIFLRKLKEEALNQGICIKHLGTLDKLPGDLVEEIKNAVSLTKDNDKMIINLALNYGGRVEIIHAIKDIVVDIENGRLDIEDISENIFDSYLNTNNQPYPEIVIRTSGEKRLSNFLLWQTSRSYIYISKVLWPEFYVDNLWEAFLEYGRQRKALNSKL